MKPGGGADAFEAFVSEVSGGALDQTVLESWQGVKQKVQMSDNPSACAREFYEASAALFQGAVWHRIRSIANMHPDAHHVRALAVRALGEL